MDGRSLDSLLGGGSFGFRMGVSPTDPTAWFAARADPGRIEARRAALHAHPERCAVASGVEAEVVEGLVRYGVPAQSYDSLVRSIASDLFVARRSDARLVAVAVAFPSGFAPESLLLRPVGSIHAIVPTLASSLGPPIEGFLARLPPGRAFARVNPGLTHGLGLDRHPRATAPRIDGTTRASDLVLRLEEQLFLGLDATIAFAVHVVERPLESLSPQDRGLVARWALSMPDEVAAYKGITPAKSVLQRIAAESSPSEPRNSRTSADVVPSVALGGTRNDEEA